MSVYYPLFYFLIARLYFSRFNYLWPLLKSYFLMKIVQHLCVCVCVCVCAFTVDHRVPVDVVRKVDTKLVVGVETGMAVAATLLRVQVERGPVQRLTATVQTSH